MGSAARPHNIRFLAAPQMVQRRLSHDCCRGRGMRPLLKLSRRQLAMRAGVRAGMSRGVTAGVLLVGAALIALWVGGETGCSKSDTTGAGARSFAQTRPGALTIAPIPFGEMNGREVYNASDIIPIADSRFLFCDNNTDDALFELDLTPDGRKKGPLIRRPLRG